MPDSPDHRARFATMEDRENSLNLPTENEDLLTFLSSEQALHALASPSTAPLSLSPIDWRLMPQHVCEQAAQQ